MQKPKRLMDQNSVSFQMFLILLSYIALGSESQISLYKQCQSITQMSRFFWAVGGVGGGGGGEHAQKPKFGDVKKKIHKALRSVQLLTSFISFYFEILSCM